MENFKNIKKKSLNDVYFLGITVEDIDVRVIFFQRVGVNYLPKNSRKLPRFL